MKFSIKPVDFLFLAISVILIALSLIVLSGNEQGPAVAVIKVKDTEYIYPLNQPMELEFEGVLDKAHLSSYVMKNGRPNAVILKQTDGEYACSAAAPT